MAIILDEKERRRIQEALATAETDLTHARARLRRLETDTRHQADLVAKLERELERARDDAKRTAYEMQTEHKHIDELEAEQHRLKRQLG